MAPAHRNQRLRELRAVFNYGLKKGWTDRNPIMGMDFVQRQVAEPEVYEPGNSPRSRNRRTHRAATDSIARLGRLRRNPTT